MAGVNKVILIGNLGGKPEMKFTPSGTPYTKFSIATTERWGQDEDGTKKEHTEWHRITAWRKLAEICNQYLDKGMKVYIEGRIRTDKYTGQDGITRWMTQIIADNMVMLTPKGGTRDEVVEEPELPVEYPSSSQKTSFPKKLDEDEIQEIDLDDESIDNNFL